MKAAKIIKIRESIRNENQSKYFKRAISSGEIKLDMIEKYIVIRILMGIIKLPSIENYWSKDPLLVNSLCQIMSQNSYINVN